MTDTVNYFLALKDGTSVGRVQVGTVLPVGHPIDYDGRSYIIKKTKLRPHASNRNLLNQGFAIVEPVGLDPENPLDYISLNLEEATK